MLEALVNGPGDGGGGHLIQHSRLQALQNKIKKMF
jgi:hypothetical protein